MPSPCPACGSPRLVAVAEHYETQVRLPDADPEALAKLAPPIRRSVFHGTACITLFFLSVLSPGFVGPDRMLPVAATFAALGTLTLITWIRARRTDRAAMSAYHSRRICETCHWTS